MKNYALFILISCCVVNSTTGQAHLDIFTSSTTPFRIDGASPMFAAIYEGGSNRGYFGSFSGNNNDVDFGTSGSNGTGKVHLTTSAIPRLTVDANGMVGIGTMMPSEMLTLGSGNLQLLSSSKGVILNAIDRPLITRGFDSFTSGLYSGLGRWGLFMEPSRLTLGIPNLAGKAIEFARYESNSSRTTLLTVDRNGEMTRPSQGTMDLLPTVMGNVNHNGVIFGGTGNFSVEKVDTGRYYISLDDGPYTEANYIVIATPIRTFNYVITISVGKTVDGEMGVFIENVENGDAVDQSFNFVMYKI